MLIIPGVTLFSYREYTFVINKKRNKLLIESVISFSFLPVLLDLVLHMVSLSDRSRGMLRFTSLRCNKFSAGTDGNDGTNTEESAQLRLHNGWNNEIILHVISYIFKVIT